jgi:hypothetical protein
MTTVTLSLFAGAGAQFLDNSGNVLTGGLIYTYSAGTTTPLATYTSNLGTSAHPNPIVLDASGRVPGGEIWLAYGYGYKFLLKDSNNVLIGTYDNIPSAALPPIFNDASSISYEQGYTATAGAFIVGSTYLITSVGTTNFQTIGAVSNTIGILFTATGAGSGTGTAQLSRTVQNKLQESISVVDFGADPTGVTDSTTAIQNGINAALAANKQIIAQGTYKISSKITIKGDTDFSQAIFNVYSTPAIAVEISTGSATNPTDIINNSVIWLPKSIVNQTKPSVGWAGQGIGVRTVNAYSCQIFVGNVVNFATGLQLTSYSTNNNAYNNYYLGHLENNQRNIQMICGDTTSAVNENTFIGGRCSHHSSEGTNISGVRQILINKSTNSINNNIFIRCSVEGDVPEYHLECGGTTNTFQQCRWEATTPKVLYIGDNNSQGIGNIILYGYGVDSIVYTYSGSTNGSYNNTYGLKNQFVTVGSTNGIGLSQTFSSNYPIHTFYPSTVKPETALATDWTVKHSSQNLIGKKPTDAYERIKLDYLNGGIGFGDGTYSLVSNFVGETGFIYLQNTLHFVPYPDNTISLGTAAYRWTTVYATTGAINTSDGNQKEQVADLSIAEKAVAKSIKSLIKTFKFKDSVKEKGDKARIHIGVIAQEVQIAFQEQGLDATKYGLFCSDILEDGTVQLGIRYDELLAFVISAI